MKQKIEDKIIALRGTSRKKVENSNKLFYWWRGRNSSRTLLHYTCWFVLLWTSCQSVPTDYKRLQKTWIWFFKITSIIIYVHRRIIVNFFFKTLRKQIFKILKEFTPNTLIKSTKKKTQKRDNTFKCFRFEWFFFALKRSRNPSLLKNEGVKCALFYFFTFSNTCCHTIFYLYKCAFV